LIRNQKLWLSAAPLVVIHILVLGAVFFAPYDPAEQHRDFPFAPPMRLRFVNPNGKLHLRPYVCSWANQTNGIGAPHYEEDCSRISRLRFLVRDLPNHRPLSSDAAWHLFGADGQAAIFLLGTDDYGRDQLSRLLYGGRISLFAGLLATGLSLGLGLLLGSVAGYFGSWVDDTIMRVAEVFMALPWIYLLFAVRAFLPLQVGARESFFILIGVVGLTGWARPSRLIRGVILSAKERDFVRAARGFGASSAYILRRHLLPETSSVVLTQAALLIPQFILAEVTLSFLGLGVGEPVASWGNMLGSLQKYYVLQSYWWMFLPGIALIPIFLLYNVLADAVMARFHPQAQAEVSHAARRRKLQVAS
jgi:peptide/nickel transport system permease protein